MPASLTKSIRGINEMPAASDFSQGPAPGNASFGTDGTSIAEYIQIRTGFNNSLENLFASFLGWVKPRKLLLQRGLPLRHPFWDHAICTRIHEFAGLGGATGRSKQSGLATYDRYRVGLTFTVPRYKIVSDNKTPGESGRFVIREPDPHVTGFKPPFDMRFVGTSTTFRGTVSQILSMFLNVLTWVDVPYSTVLGPDGFLKDRLSDALGHVNSVTYMGRPPGTLLFKAMKIKSKVGPLPPRFYGLAPGDTPLLLDVSFALDYNPFGWNSAPKASADRSKITWTPISLNGQANGASVYPTIDFNDILFTSL